MRFPIGFLGPLLVLATACSDDGLATQSSGQAATSTTGEPVADDVLTGANAPSSSSGPVDDETTGTPPPGDTTAASEGTGATSTAGPEVLTDTGTGPGTDADTGSSSSGSETEGTTGGPNQACVDGCAVEFTCGTEWASAEDCVAWCEANLVEADGFSPFCRDAWEALSVCLATLTCEEFMQWESPMAFPYPCSDADVVLSVECKGQ
jgi:hypothetical protein